MSRHVTVNLEWDDDSFTDMTGDEIRTWLLARFEALSVYWNADVIITVGAERG